ncbi:MAG: glycosyltransferase family 4 protein [Candidatus Acidiferrales bacterium]
MPKHKSANATVTAPFSASIHITGLFSELLGVGGVQEAGRLTSLALDRIAERRGWSTTFGALNDPAGPQQFSIDGRTIALQGFSRAKTQFVLATIRSSRIARGSSSHIVLAGHPNLAPIAVWMQKTLPRAHAIVIAHGIEVWQQLPLVRRTAIRHARVVAGPSSDTIQKLIDVQAVHAERTRLLPWPLNPDFLALTKTADLPLPPAFPSGQVILTIGRTAASERYKGTDDLIRAVSQLRSEFPDLHLVAIGGGDDLPRLRTLADDLGSASNVHFLQRLSREELAACYAHADVFAMPSAGEGFGLVFLEALAFGKPVVAAACGGALDLVQDGSNGLLVPGRDSAALTSAVRRLLGDESLRSAFGTKGAAVAREKYRFESFEASLEHLLEECAL